MRLHLIPTTKFKTLHMIAKFRTKLNREDITKRALLSYVLRQGTKNNPSRSELEERLDELYGAGLGIDDGKRGENHIISFRLELANDKFIPNAPDMLQEGINLLREVVFETNAVDGKFTEDVFNRERETLRQRIRSVKEDKMSYAQMRLIDEMCEGESYALHIHGYESDLDSITPKDLYAYYEKMIVNDELDLYILGDFDTATVKESAVNAFGRTAEPGKVELAVVQSKHVSELRELVEKENIQQAKLHIGYRTHCTYRDPEYYALQVFNGIFGGFPNSKLFMNVREKHSLAYYAASRLESHAGLMFVFSGIAPDDYTKAREIIELQFKDMKAGDFSEEILEETKGLIINDILETLDHPQGIIELKYQQVLAGENTTPEEMIEGIRAVNKEDVLSAASKIEEDMVYLLTNDGGSSDEEAAI